MVSKYVSIYYVVGREIFQFQKEKPGVLSRKDLCENHSSALLFIR